VDTAPCLDTDTVVGGSNLRSVRSTLRRALQKLFATTAENAPSPSVTTPHQLGLSLRFDAEPELTWSIDDDLGT
jgi:hypothetical protein